MGKIKLNLYVSLLLLFISHLPLIAEGTKALEQEALISLQEGAFSIGEDGSSLSLKILLLETDKESFAPSVLVKSDIAFTHSLLSERRALYFLTESEESIQVSFINELEEMLPSVLATLYAIDADPYRLYYADHSILSVRKDGGDNLLGKRVVTTDYSGESTSLLLVTSVADQWMYLHPLWAKEPMIKYMKVEKGPSSSLSILLPFNLNSIAIDALYELFPMWGVLQFEAGLQGEVAYDASFVSFLAQLGVSGTLPSSLFFSNKEAIKWYSHLSFIAKGNFGIGIRIENGVNVMYQSSLSLLLQYQITSSIALSTGGIFSHSTYMPTKDSFIEYSSSHLMLGLAILW